MRAAPRQPIRLGGSASTNPAKLAPQSISTAAKSGADSDACAFRIPKASLYLAKHWQSTAVLPMARDRSNNIPTAAAQPA
jgi:hypothetical protein